MAEISAAMVKELREKTGAGMMDCKRALTETQGDIEKAAIWLREKGLAAAAKKASRVAAEGVIYSYIHGGGGSSYGRVGVLLEVNCETDFVGKNEDFRTLVHELSLQIAAMKPQWVRKEEVPEETLKNEHAIARAKALNEGKPEKIVDRIAEGVVTKFVKEGCLLEQEWVKDSKKTCGDLVKEAIAKIGENISVRRFVLWEVGEGLQKRDADLGGEVAKLLQ